MSKADIVVREVNEELKRKFKSKVAKEGQTMTGKLKKMIEEYVNTNWWTH